MLDTVLGARDREETKTKTQPQWGSGGGQGEGKTKHGYGAWHAGWWNVSWRRRGSKEGMGTGSWNRSLSRGLCDCLCVLCAGATTHAHFTAEGTEARQSTEPLS